MSTGSDSPEFNAILAEILRAEEAGEAKGVEDWCEAHPAFAESIQEFFAERAELGLSGVFAGALDLPTVLPDTEPSHLLKRHETIRYFGDYEIEEEVARGGMGVVYRARQVSLNRTVALKMILAGELATPDLVTRFRKEAEAAARLDHPGIVPIHEIGQHNDQHYFSMAFVDGSSLADRVGSGPLPPKEAAETVALVADAIQHAHDNGVIHRDLKPANVLLDAGQPKVTDFGLAKRLDQQSMTATGEVLGTPGYMAPEQASNAEAAGKPSDVYGLGAILYATLTGRPPFQSANVVETLCQLMTEDCVPPRRLNPAVPGDLETICLAALRKEPTKRYTSAAELAADLRRFLQGRPIHARPVSSFEHVVKWAKRRPLIASLSAALVCTLVVGSAIIASLWIDEREARVAATDAAERASQNAVAADAARKDALAQKKIAEANLVTSSLSIADLVYANGDVNTAMQRYREEYLAAQQRGDSDRRAWWRLWRAFAEYPCERWLPVSASWVTASPNGKFIAAVNGSQLHVLEGQTFEQLKTLEATESYFWQAGFSPDGKYLVANHFNDPHLWLWETEQLDAKPREFSLSSDPMSGRLAVLESQMDKRTMQFVRKQVHAKTGFGFDAKGNLLAVGASALWSFDVSAPEKEATQIATRQGLGFSGVGDAAALAQSGNRYWVSRFGAMLGLPLTLIEVSESGESEILYPAFEDDRLLYIPAPQTPSSALGMSDSWLAFPAEQREKLLQSDVFAIHPNDLRLAAIHQGALSIWDLQSGERIAHSEKPTKGDSWEGTKRLTFSPDGRKLLAIDSETYVLDTESLAEQHRLRWLGDSESAILSGAFSGDGRHLILPEVGDFTKPIRLGVYATSATGIQVEMAESNRKFADLNFTFDLPTSMLSFRRAAIEMSGDSPKRFEIPKEYRVADNSGAFYVAHDRSRFVLPAAHWQENPFESTQLFGFETDSGRIIGPHKFDQTPLGVSLSHDGKLLMHLEAGGVAIHSLPDFEKLGHVNLIRDELRDQLDEQTGWGMYAVCSAVSENQPLVATGFAPILTHESRGVRFASDSELAVVDLEKQSVVAQRTVRGLTKALFLDDGKSIAVTIKGASTRIEILKLPGLETSASWDTGADSVDMMAEAAEMGVLAAVLEGGRIAFWDVRRSELLAIVPLLSSGGVIDLRFSADEKALLVATRKQRYRIDMQAVRERVDAYVALP